MVRKGYRDPPYHNWTHAFSVAHFCYLLYKNSNLMSYLTWVQPHADSCLHHRARLWLDYRPSRVFQGFGGFQFVRGVSVPRHRSSRNDQLLPSRGGELLTSQAVRTRSITRCNFCVFLVFCLPIEYLTSFFNVIFLSTCVLLYSCDFITVSPVLWSCHFAFSQLPWLVFIALKDLCWRYDIYVFVFLAIFYDDIPKVRLGAPGSGVCLLLWKCIATQFILLH